MRQQVVWSLILLMMSVLNLRAEVSAGVQLAADDKPVVFYDYTAQKCSSDDYPDAPARAIRLPSGEIALAASHYTTRLSYLQPGQTLRHDCRIVLKSAQDPDPSHFDDKVWIAALWRASNGEVFALLHDEYQAHLHPGKCVFKSYLPCWYNSVVFANASVDDLVFKINNPRIVAAAPFRQIEGQGVNRGFFNPSNIVKSRGRYYSFFFWSGFQGSRRHGSCLFETTSIGDFATWRAYDGSAFSAAFPDPYIGSLGNSTCEPLLNEAVSSLVQLDNGSFIAFFQKPGEANTKSFIGYSYSTDLLHWSEARKLIALPSQSSKDCSDKNRFSYPSAIDLSSNSDNFDHVGKSFYLFLTSYFVEDCRISDKRDLVAFKVSVQRLGGGNR